MSGTTKQAPVADALFTTVDGARHLRGSRCGQCAVVTFPTQTGCPRCGAEDMSDLALERRGTLWTWTTQGFLPKAPYAGPETDETFEPFLVGYVELAGQVLVEARLVDCDVDSVAIGMDMELVFVPFRTEPDGTQIITYAFRPVG